MTTITSDNQYTCHDLSLLNGRENHNFAQSKLTLQHIIYHQRKNSLEQAAFWHQVKVKCCLLTPFLHAKLTTLIDNLADRRSAINRQEGGIAASKVCLKALPLSLPSPPNFFGPSPKQKACSQAICCIFQTLQREKRKTTTYNTSEKRHKISKVAIYQNKRKATA